MTQNMRTLPTLKIRTVEHLCKHLGTDLGELEKLCPVISRYYTVRRQLIGGKLRPIAVPQGRLREILDRLQLLLRRLLVSSRFHGGRPKRSPISNAHLHVGKPVVLRIDLKDFFPNITSQRIYSLFHEELFCHPEVARYLTTLTTLRDSLPQGSPTSTTLANLVLKGFAQRISSLAHKHNATYTQYIDDCVLSGPKHISRLLPLIDKIARQEGFTLNYSKTGAMERGEEQVVTGVKVNRQIDVPSRKLREITLRVERAEADKRLGKQLSPSIFPSLEGKIQHVARLNPGAAKLLRRRLRRLKQRLENPA